MTAMHYELSDQERRAISESARRGAHFERPWMICRTGDGHAQETRVWSRVTCERCLALKPKDA